SPSDATEGSIRLVKVFPKIHCVIVIRFRPRCQRCPELPPTDAAVWSIRLVKVFPKIHCMVVIRIGPLCQG
ncbi:hypothetical protein BaRGS_00000687, partial [Batillaria attramentaria]